MTRSAKTLGLGAIGAAVVGGTLMYTGQGGGGSSQETYRVTLQATPREVDEGDLVEFVGEAVIVDPATGASPTPGVDMMTPDVLYTWDFDDGTAESSGLDLKERTHRFADGAADFTPHRVRLTVGQSDATTVVIVNNVAPSIRNTWRSRPALQGEPVEFEVSATDPGTQDELSYAWDFGDGGTATGRRVDHTFDADGLYTVTVTVNDGDGGEDTSTLDVAVGEVGWFTISGDIPLPRQDAEFVRVIGVPSGSGQSTTCQLRLDMQDGTAESGVTLTAHLDTGFGERDYLIAESNEWDGMYRDERGHPGVFFAEVQIPRRYAIRNFFGRRVGGPFWSRGGEVTVDFFDGEYIELRYSATLVENIPGEYDPRTVFVQGGLSKKIAGSLSNVFSTFTTGSASAYACGLDEPETFDVASTTPAANSRAMAFQNPEIEITFTKPIDPGTVAGNVQLDYRLPGGPGETIPPRPIGVWQAIAEDPSSVRYVPQGHLQDGVIYCVRVRAGRDGLRGQDGEVLEPDGAPSFSEESRAACLRQPWPGQSRDWSLTTRVEIESLYAALYQASHASLDSLLAPHKPTVSRVYPYWDAEPGVHDVAQVKRFPARMSVLAGGQRVYAPKRVDVVRPDQYDAEDWRHARHTVNFYNWRPTGGGPSFNVQPILELLDDSGSTVDTFEGRVDRVGMWDRTEILSFDYYFIRVKGTCATCDWTGDIADEWRAMGRAVALEGAVYTTQNFPVIETQPRPMGDVWIDEPDRPTGLCQNWGPEWANDVCFAPGTGKQEAVSHAAGAPLFEAGRESYADIIVGFVPSGFLGTPYGVTVPFDVPGMRVVLVELDPGRSLNMPATLAHEFGHFFNLDHCPEYDGKGQPLPCEDWVQGLRVSPSGRSGMNKHDVEGNQEADELLPLMNEYSAPMTVRFIAAYQYGALFNEIPATPRRQPQAQALSAFDRLRTWLARTLLPMPVAAQDVRSSGSRRIRVSGTLRDGQLTLGRVTLESAGIERAAGRGEGTLRIDLLDAAGGVLSTASMVARPGGWAHGPPAGVAMFNADLPAPDGVQGVRVATAGGQTVERRRSANAPTVVAEVASPDAAGGRILQWSAADTDGDDLRFDVYVRADETSWRLVAFDITQTELTLDSSHLPPGRQITARVVAHDGFNAGATEVDLGPGASLSVLATMPANGALDVPLVTDVTAWISSPMLVSSSARVLPLQTGSFRLVDAGGNEVFADVVYQPGTGLITLTPNTPLEPGTRYTATIEALEDRWGGRLEQPVRWSFRTRGRVSEPAPAGGDRR